MPFLRSLNICKIRVKVGPKTNYFSYFMSSCTNRIAVFSNSFSLIYSQPRNKQNRALDFFSFWIFLNNQFLNCFYGKYAFKTRQIIAIKMNNSLSDKTRGRFCAASILLEICVQSLQLIVWDVFVLKFVKCSPPRNHSLAKFL